MDTTTRKISFYTSVSLFVVSLMLLMFVFYVRKQQMMSGGGNNRIMPLLRESVKAQEMGVYGGYYDGRR